MKQLLFLSALTISAALTGCGQQAPESAGEASVDNTPQQVNIYSYRKEALIKPVLDAFSDKTGIQVNLVTGKEDALFQRLKSEGENSPADLLITSDAGRLFRAKEAGLLQKIDSGILNEKIPSHLRDSDGQWYGLSARARVIFYNKDKVTAEELISYEDLADDKWRDRICIRSSGNIYNQSLLASLIAHNGEAAALEWAKAVVANMAREPKGNDRAQMAAAAIGECDIAIANTYYYGAWLTSDEPLDRDNASRLAVLFPNQASRGAHINISGAGVTRYAGNRDNAIKLLEYLVSAEAQKFYAEVNHEYPVVAGAPVSDIVQSWGYPFKADTLELNKLGELNATAVKLFDQAGWK